MPEYVYALHDFTPEHEDEVSFHAGERIEVIEKDEQYSDGWWQGRNLAGQVGLFPQSYTTSAPPEPIAPSTSTPSTAMEVQLTDSLTLPTPQDLREEEEAEPPVAASTSIVVPVPQSRAPAIFLNSQQDIGHEPENDETSASITSHQRTASSSEGVMKATMTDVQEAIEQLGRSNAAGDEARSFSFASSTGDVTEGDTDTEYDMSDVDVGPSTAGGETWHKGARTKLAERAKRAVEEAEKLEAMMNGASSRGAPPIDVEMSDESEGEEEYTTHSGVFSRDHPHIPEEEEEDERALDKLEQSPGLEEQKSNSKDSLSVKTGTTAQETSTLGSEWLNYEAKTATATQTSFPVFHPPHSPSLKPGLQTQHEPAGSKRSSDNDQERYPESLVMLPSSNSSTPAQHSKHSSVASAASARPSASELSPLPLTASSIQTTLVENQVDGLYTAVKEAEKEKKHPTEWDIGEVVEWLKGRGFDQDVCEKFTEQEITGDVLLELDVNLLKTELGIMAFGKRMRIANAITDLRRPPSFIYSESATGGGGPGSASLQRSPSLMVPHSPMSVVHSQSAAGQGQGQGQGHSRGQSQTYSTRSFPGSGSIGVMGVGQVYNYASVQGSSMVYGNGNGGHVESPEETIYHVPPGEQVQGQVESVGMGMSASAPAMAAENGKINGRPVNLMLSPSDGVLKTTVIAVSDVQEEDRGAASEGETHTTSSMRRRLFGRSYDSNNSSKLDSSSRHSRDGSISGKGSFSIRTSPTALENGKGKDKEKEREKKSKRSGDSATGKNTGDRLSIFGSTFGGTLGKGRKPPPKYPNAINEASSDHSPLSFFGLSSSSRKVPDAVTYPDKEKKHPTTSSATAIPKAGTPKPPAFKNSGKEPRDPALLRKRTASAPAPPITIPVGSLKQGMSILEQIGEADHKGWMRKKGDRYNTWKMRYFVLKGPDLYCLRSNSPAETKIKGYVNILGYKVTVDENVNPGRYGFRIDHEHDKTHYFSSDEKSTIRDWMKAIMKATIGRDYTKPVISSCNIPTIPLMVAQAMNPAPRPPSPSARAATQKAMRRENTNQLSTRDARVLMGLPSAEEGTDERARLNLFSTNENVVSPSTPQQGSSASAPARPSREMRRVSTNHTPVVVSAEESALVEWANSHLSLLLRIRDPTGPICGGLHLLRIAESIKGKPTSPPVPDSAFPQSPTDDKLDGLFQLFDFLLDNDVKMGSVSINDVRQGKRDKIVQLLRALKAWEDKRRALATSIGSVSPVSSGGFIVPVPAFTSTTRGGGLELIQSDT
ncbi:Protein pob1 [Termitomyces sp. T112]|nr:Protein pob1 [Termitomyces sp. T112]